MISREQRTPLSEWWWTVDRPLLAAMIVLMLTGVVLSLAASPSVATRIGLDPFHFFHRHVLFLIPSIVVMIGVSFLSPRQIRRSALIMFALSIILVFLYYVIMQTFQAMGNAGIVPPIAAAWTQNILFGIIGIFLMTRVDRQ